MLGLDQGAVTVTSMRARQQKCAASANLRPDSLQVVYVRAANHPAQVNGRRFVAQIVALGNLLGGVAGAKFASVVVALAGGRRQRNMGRENTTCNMKGERG